MKIELPETFVLPSTGGKYGEPIQLGFTGHITIPDTWTGGDYEDYYVASNPADEDSAIWASLWPWASSRIIEWNIDGLPTNPNQIDPDEHLTWVLESFLANTVIRGMSQYMQDADLEKVKETIGFPTPENLRPGEFMTWHKTQLEIVGDEKKSPLLQAWLVGKELVRQWPEGVDPKDYRKVDLLIMKAIDELLRETILPALNLGNWNARPGEA